MWTLYWKQKLVQVPIKHSKSFIFLVDYLKVFSTIKVIMCVFSRTNVQTCCRTLRTLDWSDAASWNWSDQSKVGLVIHKRAIVKGSKLSNEVRKKLMLDWLFIVFATDLEALCTFYTSDQNHINFSPRLIFCCFYFLHSPRPSQCQPKRFWIVTRCHE